MDRATFVQAGLAALVAGPSQPAVTVTSSPWNMCDKSAALPYDHPLDLRMQALDGPEFHLMAYRGQAVLLNIFATWCGPCNQEQPFVVGIAGRYAAQGLAVIGINDREPDDTVRSYRKKYEITYPIAMDRGGGFSRALEVGTDRAAKGYLPSTLFITPQGYLYCFLSGPMGRDELDYRVKKFLADAPPTTIPSPSPSPAVSP